MKILVSGSTGLVGRQLVHRLQKEDHTVIPLVRQRSKEGVLWNPVTGEVDVQGMEGYDAVVHLAGENNEFARVGLKAPGGFARLWRVFRSLPKR